MLRIWGQPIGYYKGLKNEANPLRGGKDEVDRLLMEMGLPLENAKFSYEESENYSYAPVDDDTRQTLVDMETVKMKAFQN